MSVVTIPAITHISPYRFEVNIPNFIKKSEEYYQLSLCE